MRFKIFQPRVPWFLGWPTVSFACSPLTMECRVLWLNSQSSGYFLGVRRRCFSHPKRTWWNIEVLLPRFSGTNANVSVRVCPSTPFFFASPKTAFPGISRSTSNRWTEGSGTLTGGQVYVILLGNRIVTVRDCKVIGSRTTEAHGFVWKCWVNIPNEIAIIHRDNDQQNHWV